MTNFTNKQLEAASKLTPWCKTCKPDNMCPTLARALLAERKAREVEVAALQKLYDGLAWDWRGRPVGDLPTLREIARTALEGCTV